eukprot:4468293-Pleurochrysis_carterae.AAC.6
MLIKRRHQQFLTQNRTEQVRQTWLLAIGKCPITRFRATTKAPHFAIDPGTGAGTLCDWYSDESTVYAANMPTDGKDCATA